MQPARRTLHRYGPAAVARTKLTEAATVRESDDPHAKLAAKTISPAAACWTRAAQVLARLKGKGRDWWDLFWMAK